MKIISLDLPENETMEEYDEAMDAITMQCLEQWDEEDD